jgi:small nuclear ribonucleoprotein (snRNP)-like protein
MDSTSRSGETQSGDAPKTELEADAKLRRMLMFVGEKVSVRVIWGSDFHGVFAGFDNHMNLILKKAEEIRWKFYDNIFRF